MRKNPYNKALKDHLPLFMQGPSTTTALITNEEQKAFLEESMIPPLHKYEANGVSFIMIQPPLVNLRTMTSNPQDILNVEMGQTEVTQELFEAVMGPHWNNSESKSNPQNPVENVTWFDCISFCNKLSELLGFEPCYGMSHIQMPSYWSTNIQSARVTWDEAANGFRLPKFEEWIIFAKAGTNNEWSGTNVKSEVEKYAWYEDNSGNETHPVGGKLPNKWGLYDMSGNVWEWCWDEYGLSSDNMRVVRGGSFRDFASGCPVAYRSWSDAGYQSGNLGFRISRASK